MSRRPCAFFLFVLLVGLTCPLAATAARPNIVFIYTDDQAPRAVAAAGDKRFITPHIDKIFHQGAHPVSYTHLTLPTSDLE